MKGTLTYLLLATAALPCSASDNLLKNPSLEEGREPWQSLVAPGKPFWHEFSVTADPADPANHCILAELTSAEGKEKTGIWGAVQEVPASGHLPRYLRGRYYVAEWARGLPRQYIQVVFHIWPTESRNLTPEQTSPESVPVQIAFVLAGVTKQPFKIRNRKFVFSGVEEPETRRWIDFEFDLHEAFKVNWGGLPANMDAFRVFCEARFDARTPDETGGRVTVYFDDLYLGDEAR